MKAQSKQTVIPHSRPWLTDADRRALSHALESVMIAEGDVAHTFERAVAEYLGQLGGVATPDGMTALYLALRALGVKAGDEVVIPTYVCAAVAQAVRLTGASPVLCDVGDDWCVNVDTVRPVVSARTCAVVVVHTFGIVADTKPIADLGIPVVEDLAQAFGASSPDGMAGSVGALCMTSFHATKCLTTGEGGMALSRDRRLHQKLLELKSSDGRLPMSDIQASLGLSQLERYPEFLRRRAQIAGRYMAGIKGKAILPAGTARRTCHFRFPLLVDGDVASIMAAFAEQGVAVRRGVDALLHREIGSFPGAESAFRRTLSLPIHPSMTPEDVDRVIAVANHVLQDG